MSGRSIPPHLCPQEGSKQSERSNVFIGSIANGAMGRYMRRSLQAVIFGQNAAFRILDWHNIPRKFRKKEALKIEIDYCECTYTAAKIQASYDEESRDIDGGWWSCDHLLNGHLTWWNVDIPVASYARMCFSSSFPHKSYFPTPSSPYLLAKWTSIIPRKSSQIDSFWCGYRIYSEIHQRIWQ